MIDYFNLFANSNIDNIKYFAYLIQVTNEIKKKDTRNFNMSLLLSPNNNDILDLIKKFNIEFDLILKSETIDTDKMEKAASILNKIIDYKSKFDDTL